MPRITNEKAAEREMFVINLFKEFPKVSGKTVNDQLQAKDGFRMNIARIYQLKKKALEVVEEVVEEVPPEEQKPEVTMKGDTMVVPSKSTEEAWGL